ncbi:unnamed protein product [Diatraea saccharalis]|uniref:DUF7869 domain-containing protein n=1 Tax=Diatraea saccharalis TaxID=40085 RepID=A0A9N9RAA2_9NEOP|nr:unnamed protein product [Diatraea saccharalis]
MESYPIPVTNRYARKRQRNPENWKKNVMKKLSPKTDVCSVCLQLTEKIKAEQDNGKKNELITEKRIHSLRAKAFFEKLREQCEGLITISFDFQKNLPLPKLPDQITYYSRQLYFFNLTMVVGSSNDSLGKDRVFAYCCTENQFNKDSNLVASAVYHRLTHIDKTGIRNIRLVADGCGGQNKNCIVLGACSKWLLENQNISSIELVFPVTGHSYMPADRQFGIIEKKIRKMDTIVHPDEITDVISETSTIIKLGSDCPVKDWRSSVKSVVKDTTSWPMKFKECKRFILKRSKKEGNVLIRGELFYKSDVGKAVNVCQKHKNIAMIVPQTMSDIKALNKNKLQDVKMLLKKHFGDDWVDIPTLSFYNDVLSSQSELPAPSHETNYCDEVLVETSDLRV